MSQVKVIALATSQHLTEKYPSIRFTVSLSLNNYAEVVMQRIVPSSYLGKISFSDQRISIFRATDTISADKTLRLQRS